MTSTPRSPVIFRTVDVMSLGAKELALLKKAAAEDSTGRARVCLHSDHGEPVQQMVIALVAGRAVPPHRQRRGRKTYVVMEGRLSVQFLSEGGNPEEVHELAADAEAILNFPATRWHACAALSPITVYLEIAAGPFSQHDTEWLQDAGRQT